MGVKDIIKNRRIELNMTMKEVADKVGVSEGTVSRWESGDIANMRRDKIMALAKVLDLSPNVIMEWDDTEPEPEQHYYLDDDAREMSEFMFTNPEYKVLFDASRNVKKEDIEIVRKIIEKFGGTEPDYDEPC
jgi:transcriptional regulator with XRE-family HTH domain